MYLVNCALGSKPGKIKVFLNDKSTQNSLNPYRNKGKNAFAIQEEVTIDTLDNYCSVNKIDSIDFLKIDTEGYEMEVLLGGLEKIKGGKVKFILLELGIRHLPQTSFYNDIHKKLTELNFQVFAFYRQSQSLYSDERFMMHADVLFINQEWSKLLNPSFKKSISSINKVEIK